MSIQDYLDKIRMIANSLLAFLGEENNDEEHFQNLFNLIDNHDIDQDIHFFKTVINLISKVSKNFPRNSYTFGRIERVLLRLKENIKKFLTNSEIFRIFKNNKRILLFLFEEKILAMDNYIVGKLNSFSYRNFNSEYFKPEINTFLAKGKERQNIFNKELPDDFYEKRKIGENDSSICEIIRKDNIKDFIMFINKNDYSLNAQIKMSVYETNRFLIKKSHGLTLIKYAAFFGSVSIFKYLIANEVEIAPGLLPFAIHGQNEEIIHLIQKNNIKYSEYIECLYESIKCYQNDAAIYFLNNHVYNQILDPNAYIRDSCIKCYNFVLLSNDLVDESSFYYLCKYGFYTLVNIFLKTKNIDINKKNHILTVFCINDGIDNII